MLLESSECLNIDQILWSTRGPFVAYKCVQSDEHQLSAEILAFHRGFTTFLKTYPVNAGENLDFSRFAANFYDEERLKEVLPFNANSAEPKIIENLD